MKKILLVITLSLLLGGCSLKTSPKIEQISSRQEINEKIVTPQEEISLEEKEFNASGRAKAIIDETDMWKVYENSEIGFSFSYPMHIKLLDKEYYQNKEETAIGIRIKDIGEQENPTDPSPEEEMQNIEALTSGEFGTRGNFALEDSKKVKTVGFLFAQDYMTLGRFEVCSVVLERSLTFYFNNKEITLTLYGPIDTLKETMSEYFTINKENCGEEKIWIFDKQEDFYKELTMGTASPEIQEWYNLFDQISETIIFAHR